MLSRIEKENVLSEFPNIKLSYENIIHKKVYNSDFIVAIPEGTKCFAWFTTMNNAMVCLIMELTLDKHISNVKIVNACFSNDISYGTILYGTTFNHLNNTFFCIEDILSYKGNLIDRETWGEKLIKINGLLQKGLKQTAYNNSFVVFGLPVMSTTNEELEQKISLLKYKIESIQFKLYHKSKTLLFMPYKNYILHKPSYIQENPIIQNPIIQKPTFIPEIKEKYVVKQPLVKKDVVFLVSPDLCDDIYHLNCLNIGLNNERHGVAHIPTCESSSMMNKLFRIIKENFNLDALEESDDEEEFENVNVDKFVHLDKTHKMICQFNHKFKKWCPIKLADANSSIITHNELQHIYINHTTNIKKGKVSPSHRV